MAHFTAVHEASIFSGGVSPSFEYVLHIVSDRVSCELKKNKLASSVDVIGNLKLLTNVKVASHLRG